MANHPASPPRSRAERPVAGRSEGARSLGRGAPSPRPPTGWPAALLAASALAACGGGESASQTTGQTEGAQAEGARAAAEGPTEASQEGDDPTPDPTPTPAPTELPERLPHGLLVAYSQFEVEDGRVTANPGAARLELITRVDGAWRVEAIEDPDSNVFHKAMVFRPAGGEPGILTLGGTEAAIKLWRRDGERWRATTLWTAAFGGERNRMRDAEIADLYGTGRPALAVATHDQGVVATVRVAGDGSPQVTELDRQADTFIHEIEIGDLDGDGTPEVYATPSEPNAFDGGEQHGTVVRYVPRQGQGRTVVADLGRRHAKEILVEDVDGDGRDELYVAVEALTQGQGADLTIEEPVEIRRYDADTAPDAGVVIARLRDRLCRFLTAGDLDGDGNKELVAAAFRSGLWMLRPGRDPRGEWAVDSIDRDSTGFEHAALAADLDEDGTDELYVASDEQGELRRYVFRAGGRPQRTVIHARELPASRLTWNLMPAPIELLRP
ncbi:MAG: FG-GAP repeat domain-containing protein [Sandaracinaceae bacterium]